MCQWLLDEGFLCSWQVKADSVSTVCHQPPPLPPPLSLYGWLPSMLHVLDASRHIPSTCVYTRVVLTCVYTRVVLTCVYTRVVLTCVYTRVVLTCVYIRVVLTCVYTRVVLTCVYTRVVLIFEVFNFQWDILSFCYVLRKKIPGQISVQ